MAFRRRFAACVVALAVTLFAVARGGADGFGGMTPEQVRTLVQGALPQPGSAAPPGVSVDGAAGSGVQFARADHTHATSVQRTRLTISTAGVPTRWTFAKPYDPGTTPVVTCTAQNVAGASQPFVVNTVGDPTPTYADVAVFRAQTQTLGGTPVAIAGMTINLFASAPAGALVNCQAAKPTQ